jgi:hypothetical protein
LEEYAASVSMYKHLYDLSILINSLEFLDDATLCGIFIASVREGVKIYLSILRRLLGKLEYDCNCMTVIFRKAFN